MNPCILDLQHNYGLLLLFSLEEGFGGLIKGWIRICNVFNVFVVFVVFLSFFFFVTVSFNCSFVLIGIHIPWIYVIRLQTMIVLFIGSHRNVVKVIDSMIHLCLDMVSS